jgi:hypothetical protein
MVVLDVTRPRWQKSWTPSHVTTLRYAHTRSGDFLIKLRRFEEGDLVYLGRQPADSMDPKTERIILQIKKPLGTGRLLLEGRDTKTIKEHVENCAPCHNPNVDLTQTAALLSLADEDLDQPCKIRDNTAVTNRTGPMLLCDNCNIGWYMKCLTPVLRKKSAGDWFCTRCPTTCTTPS